MVTNNIINDVNMLRTHCVIINIIVFPQFPHWFSSVTPLPSSWWQLQWVQRPSYRCGLFYPYRIWKYTPDRLKIDWKHNRSPTTGHCQIHQVIFTPSRNIIYINIYEYWTAIAIVIILVISSWCRHYCRQPTRSYTISILSL